MPDEVAAEGDVDVLERSRRDRPARGGVPACTASSSQSWTMTTVELGAVADDDLDDRRRAWRTRCGRSTTVALLCAPARDHDVRGRDGVLGAGAGQVDDDRARRARCPRGTSTASAVPASCQPGRASRSLGTKPPTPRARAVGADRARCVTPSGACDSASTDVPDEIGVACRPASRLSGVNRQISSRPVGHRVVGERRTTPAGCRWRRHLRRARAPRPAARISVTVTTFVRRVQGGAGGRAAISRPRPPSAAR